MLKVKQLCSVDKEEMKLLKKIKTVGAGLTNDYTVFVVYGQDGNGKGILCQGEVQIYPMDSLDVIFANVCFIADNEEGRSLC